MAQRNLIPHLAHCLLVEVALPQELVEAVLPQELMEAVLPQELQNFQGVFLGPRKVLLQLDLLAVLEVAAVAEACLLYLVGALCWR